MVSVAEMMSIDEFEEWWMLKNWRKGLSWWTKGMMCVNELSLCPTNKLSSAFLVLTMMQIVQLMGELLGSLP